MMKKILALVSCLLLLVPILSSCENVPETNTDYLYAENEDGIVLVRYLGSDDAVTVPSKLGGKPVTEIGPECFGRGSLSTLVIPDSVKRIDSFAFRACSLLRTTDIPESVSFISVHAFDDTPWYQDNIDEFMIVGDGVLLKYNGTSEEIRIPDSVRSIACALGRDDVTVNSIIIPDGIRFICGNAFVKTAWRRALSDEFTIVGDGILIKYAGEGGAVTIPDNVKTISGAFYDSTKVTSVKIPDSVTRIESYSFACTSGFSSTSSPNKISVLTSVDIPDSVTYVGCAAFYNCSELEQLTLPDALRFVEPQTFVFCSKLTRFDVPDKALALGYIAFGEAVALSEINWGSSMLLIGDAAFYGANSLTAVTIPEGCANISNNAFVNCATLTSVYIPASASFIASTAFSGCPDTIVISGSAGSIAETYCSDNQLTFESK